MTSLPNTYISAVSCSAYTAYLSSDSLKWRCVSTPRIFSGGDTTTCPCDTFETAMHSSCYTTYLECTSGGKTYYTAILTRSRTPTIGANSVPTVVGSTNNLISAGCTGIVGQPVCWNIHPLFTPLMEEDHKTRSEKLGYTKNLKSCKGPCTRKFTTTPWPCPKPEGKRKLMPRPLTSSLLLITCLTIPTLAWLMTAGCVCNQEIPFLLPYPAMT